MSKSIEISKGLTQVAKDFRGVLLDAYGVFWGGNDFGVIPGSRESMAKLVADGKVVGILSNSTQLAAKEIHKLSKHGLIQNEHFHFFVTSGEIAKEMFLTQQLPFKTNSKQFLLFGRAHPKFATHEAIFEGSCYSETLNINDADFIYISVPHINGIDQENTAVFAQDLQKLKAANLPMICPNPDLFAHEGQPPRPVVRQGSIAKMYEKLGGQVYYIGKPHSPAFKKAMGCFAQYDIKTPQEILMVGDTPETDVRGALAFGMPCALLLKTGIMAERIDRHGLETAIQALRKIDYPSYFIEQLKL